MLFSCFTKTIELIVDDALEIHVSELMFWLERFIPGIEEGNNPADYTIYLNAAEVNELLCNDDNSSISGVFSQGCESSIAKYIQQMFARLLLEDNYFLIPAACVQKKGETILLLGDYWQGKTSVAMELVMNLGFDIISDNYVMLKDDNVVCGTNHISVRKENTKLLDMSKKVSLVERNNRCFFDRENDKKTYKIKGLATCHINEGDNNFHIVSKEESTWFVYTKFKRMFTGECLLFDGTVPSFAYDDEKVSKAILHMVNGFLESRSLHYLSGALEKICKYIDTKVFGSGVDYNCIIKLITACPGNCACCQDRKDNFKFKNKDKVLFDIHIFERICQCIKNVGGTYVCLSGGEPTIVANLVDYIKIASDIGLNVRLNTIGYGITEEKLKGWLDAGLGQIVLSVYSLNEEMTKQLRGNEQIYRKMIRAAEAIKKAKEQKEFVFIVQSVIMNDNYHEIADIFKFAMEHNADMYWPSYLEDAVNLEKIRLTEDEIDEFKETILPKMAEYVRNFDKYKGYENRIIEDINKIYNKKYENYIYHDSNIACPWPGRHFTFYPDGIVDPCPGHEYFKSKYQWKIDYNEIESFFTLDNLEKYMFVQYDYCKYCPQGEHKGVCLAERLFHEHSKN